MLPSARKRMCCRLPRCRTVRSRVLPHNQTRSFSSASTTTPEGDAEHDRILKHKPRPFHRAPSELNGRTLYIGGSWTGSTRTCETTSPRNGASIALLADGNAADAHQSLVSARSAFRKARQAQLDRGEGYIARLRADRLRKLSESLREDKREFALLESLDCGKPVAETLVDIEFCCDVLSYYANLASEMFTVSPKSLGELRGDPPKRAEMRLQPRGVCALVTPWNYPLMQAVFKVAPCLAAGNAAILKPSPLASLTCVRFAELFHEVAADRSNGGDVVFPSGVFNLLTGGSPLGQSGPDSASVALCFNENASLHVPHLSEQADFVSFTGSGSTGAKILQSSASLLRPTSLELGGKGALVVFSDVSPEAAADAAVAGILPAAGQICSATSRLLIHEDIYESVLAAITARFKEAKAGDPLLDTTTFGAVISNAQQRKIIEAIEVAERDGATVHYRGETYSKNTGYFVPPTILTNVSDESAAWKEEIFGPVLSVGAPFKAEAEAVERVNACRYGLGHTVLSADKQVASRVANALDAGVVWCNVNQALDINTPFGGAKQSGFGWELGEEGLMEYVQRKTVIAAV